MPGLWPEWPHLVYGLDFVTISCFLYMGASPLFRLRAEPRKRTLRTYVTSGRPLADCNVDVQHRIFGCCVPAYHMRTCLKKSGMG